jgi:hypothetical protein
MWKELWQKWTIDEPARLGDWFWDVFVIQFAAFLDRLTWRRIVWCIPFLVLVLAYYHQIPIPPELMLLGDFLAYIDIFTVVLLVGLLSRAATILFILKQATARVRRMAGLLAAKAQSGFRHRRERRIRGVRRLNDGTESDDDDAIIAPGMVWA